MFDTFCFDVFNVEFEVDNDTWVVKTIRRTSVFHLKIVKIWIPKNCQLKFYFNEHKWLYFNTMLWLATGKID